MNKRLDDNDKQKQAIAKLRRQGKTIYSYSRINAFNNCQYEYYRTYILKNRGISNCYSEIGQFVHNFIEKSYRENDYNNSDLMIQLNTKLAELELLDLDFPNEKIKNAFTKDMTNYINHFNLLSGSFILEKLFLIKVKDNWLMGYIDAIRSINDETHIIDWKTSSKFTSKKLLEAGRQLVLYKVAIEKEYGMNVNKVMWNMLKYVYVCHVQKNENVKRKMVNRGKLISDMKTTFEKEMKQHGLSEIDIFMHLEKALETNSIDDLPACIREKYWVEDCFVEYDVTEELVEELYAHIDNTITEIESKDVNNVDEWRPLNVEKESFYCNTLCNHRSNCPFIKEFNKKQASK